MRHIIILVTVCFIAINTNGQQARWHHLDLQSDGYFGISTAKAFAELLPGKKTKESYCCCGRYGN